MTLACRLPSICLSVHVLYVCMYVYSLSLSRARALSLSLAHTHTHTHTHTHCTIFCRGNLGVNQKDVKSSNEVAARCVIQGDIGDEDEAALGRHQPERTRTLPHPFLSARRVVG